MQDDLSLGSRRSRAHSWGGADGTTRDGRMLHGDIRPDVPAWGEWRSVSTGKLGARPPWRRLGMYEYVRWPIDYSIWGVLRVIDDCQCYILIALIRNWNKEQARTTEDPR